MFIGIDIGTSGIKALLVDEKQNIIGSWTEPLTVRRLHPSWSEQDPDQWLKAIYHTLDMLQDQYPQEVSLVEAIGLSGQQHGAVFLDEKGQVLRPCILWNDTRADKECAIFENRFPDGPKILGSITMPSFTAPKVLWVAKNEPEIFSKTRHVLLPKAWVRYALTGIMAEDMSDASGTAWLDVKKRSWSEAALKASGINMSYMPDLCEGTDRAGYLKADLASRWKMKKRPIFAGSAGDNAAGAIGLGAINKGDSFVSLGTSGVLWMTTDSYCPNPETAIHTFCHALPNRWHQMGVMLSAAASFKWWADLCHEKEETLLAELPKTIKEPSPVLFAPYLAGERTPYNDGRVRGGFVGLTQDATRAQMTQAVLEGVAYSFRDAFEGFLKTGQAPLTADVIGGGSKSTLWVSIIASVLNMPLNKIKHGEQGGAFGAARLARLALTGEKIEEVCTSPERINCIKPDKELKQAYAENYKRYRLLYPALKAFRN
ncbi:xylulokinase [Aristophania vespae]|uniref:Xylulose kinase n=1 Tax=Aristophania vespae TaxID=2697033 RepID=A0A6P1NIR1_9PROT|nr:xylulokinase [Aristophania vespae]QHI95552.1 xylulokinase [Aristophania vespae]